MRKKGENYLTHIYYVEYLRTEINRGRDREGVRKRERESDKEGGRERECVCFFF